MYYSLFVTPWGEGLILWSEAGIKRLMLPGTNFDTSKYILKGDIFDGVKQLNYYFSKKIKQFELKLDIKGTDFQIKVWHFLAKIPYGTTMSYQQLAQQIGCPKAARAVGNANHMNPLPIIIPCHRIIKADGNIGGYGAGTDLKAALLKLEQQ